MKWLMATTTLACTLTVADWQQAEVKDVKFDMTYLEKTFGIKFKSAVVERQNQGERIKITMEFTKDLPTDKEVKVAFSNPVYMTSIASKETQLWFYMFDDDNVSVQKCYISGVEGELSGKKGDGFRVILSGGIPQKAKRVEVRVGEAMAVQQPPTKKK